MTEARDGWATWRPTHRCRIIETKCESYRLHDTRTRTRRTRTTTIDQAKQSN